ncbi:ribosomal protein L7/L12 [Cladophialophora immunda]|uniref:Ribosomal protein L7/L12 n=1 Tax=Cladophialophora immunda TaxID=569365 RepID=A0A0D2C1X8_9EURO|nr:ribosomal protein L7/L12 [Cladophialophora immunda]KIW24445.1 ribosomal protein L7/L12 [Cladophialophora immunda]OQV02643.1 Ribosomal protein L7/L12 domain-containing protein [Cladophialophora immunda]
MSSKLPSVTYRCCHLASRTQKRSLSSQCLRLSSTSSANQHRRRNSLVSSKSSRRWQSTDAAAAPTNPKIAGIVDQISQLTLLETADLVASLKSRLNIPDMAFAAPAAAPAGGAAAATPAAEAEAAEEAAPAPAEKTMFTLKLDSFDATAKPKVIKEVKGLLGLSLVDSKKFVESAPKVMKEGVPKEEAEKIVAAMKALGAVVSMS